MPGFPAWILCALSLLPASRALASITPTLRYTGQLIDASTGKPVDEAKDMQFALCDSAAGSCAAPIFSESRCLSAGKAVSVLKGRYEVEIGSASAGGIPANIFTSSSAVWLEVRVDPNDDCASFEALAPRVRLTAAPYAFEALRVATAAAAASTFPMSTIQGRDTTANGGVTVSTHLIVSSGKLAAGSSDSSLNAKAWVQGGLAELHHLRVSSQSGTGDLLYIGRLGDVGVNTSAPTHRLDVNGDMIFRSSWTFGGLASAPPNSLSNQGSIYFNSSSNQLLFSENGADYQTSGGGGTYVAVSGDTMSGQLTVKNSSITVVNPTATDAYVLAVTSAGNRSVYHLYVSTMGSVQFAHLLKRRDAISYGNEGALSSHVNFSSATGLSGQSESFVTAKGGFGVFASSAGATAGGGWMVGAQGLYSVMGGGCGMSPPSDYPGGAGGSYSTVLGGGCFNTSSRGNLAVGAYSTVLGGGAGQDPNQGKHMATGAYSVLLGGGGDLPNAGNIAGGDYSVHLGGDNAGTVVGAYSVLGGGKNNAAAGQYAVAAGGKDNSASGDYSLAAGCGATASGHGSFVWSDSQCSFSRSINNEFASSSQGGFFIDASSAVFVDNGTTRLAVLSHTGVGISTAPSQATFMVGAGTLTITTEGNIGFSTSAPKFLFAVGNASMCVVMNGGRLGVGNAYPEKKLTVYGDATTWGNASGGELKIINEEIPSAAQQYGAALTLDATPGGGGNSMWSLVSGGVSSGQGNRRFAVVDNTHYASLFGSGVGLPMLVSSGAVNFNALTRIGGLWPSTTAQLWIATAPTTYDLLRVSTNASSNALVIKNDGKVGIGTNNPGTALQVEGGVHVTTMVGNGTVQITWNSLSRLAPLTSSAKMKEQILPLAGGEADALLAEIERAPMYNFRFMPDGSDSPIKLGLLAEEAPEALRYIDSNGNPNLDFYSYNGGYAWAGIQALAEETRRLEKEIRERDVRVRRLRRTLERLRGEAP